MRQPDVTSDDRVMPYRDAPQYRCVRIDGYVVFDDRVTRYVQHVALLVVFEALSSQRHALIQCHVTADNTRFADHYARTVVYREIFADLCTGWISIPVFE